MLHLVARRRYVCVTPSPLASEIPSLLLGGPVLDASYFIDQQVAAKSALT